jgi:hypothetical protein
LEIGRRDVYFFFRESHSVSFVDLTHAVKLVAFLDILHMKTLIANLCPQVYFPPGHERWFMRSIWTENINQNINHMKNKPKQNEAESWGQLQYHDLKIWFLFSIAKRSSKWERSISLFNTLDSKLGHQLDESWKSKIYKRKLAAEVFRQAVKIWPRHLEPSSFFYHDRHGHILKVIQSQNGLIKQKKSFSKIFQRVQ